VAPPSFSVTLLRAPVEVGDENGTIIFAPEPRGGLELISAAGGTPQILTAPDFKKGETAYRWPQLLPGDNQILFSILGTMQSDVRIVVQSLNTRERRVLVHGAATARYASPGYLVYLQNGSLMAAPFDSGRLELTGTRSR